MDQKRQVKVMAYITAICLLGDSMLYVVLPTHWEEIGLTSLWEVGILLSVNRLIRLPLGPLIGWIYRKMSIRTGLLIAILLSVITTTSYGLFSTFWLLLIMRCMWGIAWSLLRLGSYFAILDASTEQNRGHLMGTFNGLYRLGSLFGMLLGGIFADFVGLELVARILGFLALLALPLLPLVTIQSTGKGSGSEIAAVRPRLLFLKDRSVLFTFVTSLVVTMLFQGMFISILSYVIESNNPHINLLGVGIGAASLAGILQAIRWGWEPFLAPRFGKLSDGGNKRLILLVTSLFITAFLFAMIPMDISFGLWLLVLMGIQLMATVLTTVMDAIALDVAQRTSRVAVMTGFTVITDLGAAIGPTLGYFMVSVLGLEITYWVAAGIWLILWGTWHFSGRKILGYLPYEKGVEQVS